MSDQDTQGQVNPDEANTVTSKTIHIEFDNSYAKQLPDFISHQLVAPVPNPELVKFNYPLAQSLNITLSGTTDDELAQVFSGQLELEGSAPLAQAYAGHQFGHYNPQLGDGRALLLGETLDTTGSRKDIQLKGSGRTDFSRNGDGKAGIGPVLREYLVSEAMFALGVPTTRALAAVTTGEEIWRTERAPGAILTRIASSHIRVGTFQYVAAKGNVDEIRLLADYTIQRHYPEALDAENPYLRFLELVCEKQAKLIAKWQLLGFIHGVMNTDNTTVSGETIDYGPCAFMESYHPDTVFSSIDSEGRYAYQNQPYIGQWNLARFAESFLPLISEDQEVGVELATKTLHGFMNQYNRNWSKGMADKLGLTSLQVSETDEIISELLHLMESKEVDYTLCFSYLIDCATGVVENSTVDDSSLLAIFQDSDDFSSWFEKWKALFSSQAELQSALTAMRAVNPVYIPRNHKVEEALAAAEDGDYQPFEALLAIITHPFDRKEGLEAYEQPAPLSLGRYQTFCGT